MKKKVIISIIIVVVAIILGVGAYYIITKDTKTNKQDIKQDVKKEVYSKENQESAKKVLDNSEYRNLEDIALEKYTVLDNKKDNKNFNYDFDGDGKKEKLTLKEENSTDVYLLQLNGKTFDENRYDPTIYI